MNQDQLNEILAKHKAWLNDEPGGERANLSRADLSRADLSDATLTLLALGEPEEWRFFTGCFRGTRAELVEAVAEKHGETKEQANYLRAIEYLWQTALSNR